MPMRINVMICYCSLKCVLDRGRAGPLAEIAPEGGGQRRRRERRNKLHLVPASRGLFLVWMPIAI
eukprot:3561730-Heterocapsa_arctica.AAC.1